MKTREKLKKIYTLEDSDEEEEIVISDSDDDFKPTTPKIPKKRKLKSEFEEKPVKKRKYNKKVKAEKKTEEIVVPHDDHSTSNNTNIENRIKKEENEEKDDIKPIRSYHEELSTSNTNIVNFHEPISENVTKRTIKNEYEEKDDIKPLRSYHDEPSTSNNTKIKRGIKNGEDVENDDVKPIWNDHELLAQQKDLTPTVAKNIVKLFEAGNTIPFIARYRRDATGNMSPEILRDVKDVYDDICHLKQKIQTVVKTVSKSGNLNSKLDKTIKSVRSIEELEIIYAPFKPGGKRSLAERGKELGLEEPALNLLYNTKKVDMYHYISVDKKELAKVENVEKGIIHIIAYVIATDSEMLSYLREL